MLSKEKEREIIEAYRDRSLSVKEICDMCGIPSSTLSNVLSRNNEPRRCPNHATNKSKNPNTKTCPNCRRKIDVKGARFCPFCAADVRSPKELLVERLTRLVGNAGIIPTSIQEDFIRTINDAINMLGGD